jgi:hypothetical protein
MACIGIKQGSTCPQAAFYVRRMTTDKLMSLIFGVLTVDCTSAFHITLIGMRQPSSERENRECHYASERAPTLTC